MLRRLKNLWEWSGIDPHEAGQEVGNTIVEAIRHFANEPKAEIVYPIEEQPKAEITGAEDLDKALQELSQ